MIPTYASMLSLLVLVLHVVVLASPLRRLLLKRTDPDNEGASVNAEEPGMPTSLAAEVRKHVSELGGSTVFLYLSLRFLGSLLLLGLSVASLVSTEAGRQAHAGSGEGLFSTLGKWGKKHRRRHRGEAFTMHEWLQVAMCMTFLYTSFLALVSLSVKRSWSKRVSRHLAFVLFVVFGVYFWRDLWPLATYHLKARDLKEGWVLNAKLITLFIITVVLPLTVPRQYIPVDLKNPMKEPNPEQTASILSFVTYHFLDGTIWRGYRMPHLSFEHLPPLADYDKATNLTSRSFPHLDPSLKHNDSHLFWGLLRVFRVDYCILAVLIVIQVVASFAPPWAINRLLNSIENNGEGSTFKPWFWILWIFLGPIIVSFSMQYAIYTATAILVRAECIITQLVFEHSLRIRVKAEAGTSAAPSQPSTAGPTPDSGSILDEVTTSSDNSETTQVATGAPKKAVPIPTLTPCSSAGDSEAGNLVGKINNLVTTDLMNIVEGRDWLIPVLLVPLQVILCVVFLYQILGWSAFVGMGVMVALFPIPGYVAKWLQSVQDQRLKKTDARVQTVTETMNVLRMIKLFGWEKQMGQRIHDKREDELYWVYWRQVAALINQNTNFAIPLITMIASYTTYTVVMKQPLNASIVFSSMTVFDMLRSQLHLAIEALTTTIQAQVSLDRVDDFLRNTELLDEFDTKPEEDDLNVEQQQSEEIGFKEVAFSWSKETHGGTLTPSRRRFRLRIEDELRFEKGGINLIIGPTGSGKTSLLMALLGEMHCLSSGPGSWFSLPRQNGVAYAAQESWVQNETIRDNILFGSSYDEARYKKVLYQCALERDLQLFEAGDATEVGEKGLTLSGGQKARITLARAIYSSAQLLLLDDVLAALDVHTSKWIIDKCFAGDLVNDRTILLVTHNVALAAPIADLVVSLSTDGTIASKGTVSEALAKNKELAAEVAREKEAISKVDEEVDAVPEPKLDSPDGKLTVAEDIAEGHVSWAAMKLYLLGLGGKHPMLFFVTYLSGMMLTHSLLVYQVYFLGQWAAEYEKHDSSEVSVPYWLTAYSMITLAVLVLYSSAFVAYLYGCMRASRSVHMQLVESVIGTNLRWLDTTPVSRVITRCTQDIRAVDGRVSELLNWLIEHTDMLIIRLFAILLTAPLFLIAGVAIFIVGGACGQLYIQAQLSVKREMSNAKSPVLSHFGAAITGLTSIRAYSAQQSFKAESLNRIDRYTRSARTFYNLNRWICVRVDGLGAAFAASLAFYLVYIRGGSAATTGFTLSMAISFSGIIIWWIRILNEFEVAGNSLERIQEYIDIEHEVKPTEEGEPSAAWPTSGDLEVNNLSARYSPNGPRVLHNVSFKVKSGERVGVVGRTGSGKSSLTLSLLRCIYTDGEVYYDGMPASKLNLDALRSNITIIPQVPELLSGTLRSNLDIFSTYDDAQLNEALRSSGLFSLQSEDDEGRITLDSAIASGGSNLSIGQRQIIALARAILRGTKLLILDEATSAIDYETDSIIQNSLRNQVAKDVTIITIAHRLQTIMDSDKIMVLDAGRVVEFGSPKELLENKKGQLRALVDESNDAQTLIDMANK